MEGDIVRRRVPFLNKSADSVEIEIVSACSCFEIDWPRRKLAPGETDSLDLAFFSAAQMGEHEKQVDLILKNEDEKGYPGIERLTVKMHVLTWDEKAEMDKKAEAEAKRAAKKAAETMPADSSLPSSSAQNAPPKKLVPRAKPKPKTKN